MDILVTTERLESRVGEKYAFEEWGLTLEVLTKAVAREKKLEEVNGFVVIGVEEGYPGRVSGLRRGDVIKKYNGDELVSMKVLKELYASYKADHKEVFMEVMRGDSIVYLVMKK